MTIQYRRINHHWCIFPEPYVLWTGLDYRTECYWIVPGTVDFF